MDKLNNTSSNNRLLKNTLLLYIRMFLTMGITLYTSRLIFQVLGVEDFGIYNIVGGVAAIFVSISSSLGVASTRFITYSLGADDEKRRKEVFSTTIITHAYIALFVFILCETIGLYFLYYKLVIPAERFDAACIAYHLSVLSIVFVFFMLPYNAVITAYEKMDVYACLTIFEVILRLAILYPIKMFSFDRLEFYAFLLLTVQVTIQLIYWIYCKKNFSMATYSWVWDWCLQKEMLVYSLWIFCGNITSSLYVQGVNIVLNMYFGPIVNAAQGIAVQVQSAIMRFGQNFQTALRPQIIIAYAQNDSIRLFNLVCTGIKLTYYLMFLLALPVIINIDYILNIWLGEVPEYTSSFVVIFVIVCVIRTFASPMMIAVQATSNIRKVQLWECSMVLMLPISYILVRFVHVSPNIVFIVSILLEFISLAIRMYVTAEILNFNIRDILLQVVKPTITATAYIFFTTYLLYFILKSNFIDVDGFYLLLFSSLMAVISIVTFGYIVGLSAREREYLISLKNKYIKH